MPNYFISDNAIVGEDFGYGTPQGWLSVETDLKEPIDRLYWTGDAIAVIPDRPSESAQWGGTSWVEPAPPIELMIAPVASYWDSAEWVSFVSNDRASVASCRQAILSIAQVIQGTYPPESPADASQ
jgi:hypothetical protein